MRKRQREAQNMRANQTRTAGLAAGTVQQHYSNNELLFVAADLEVRLEEAEAKCQELEAVVDIQKHDIAALHADHAYRAGAIGRAEAENYSLKLALHQAEQRHILQSQELQKTQQELAKARS